MFKNKSYTPSFILAVILHIVLFTVLFVHFAGRPTTIASPNTHVKIVEAVAVNQQQVEQQIAEIKQEKQRKADVEQQRIERLQRQALAAKRQRQQEQQRLVKMRTEQKKVQEKIAEQKALVVKETRQAAIRAKQQAARQAKLKREQAVVAKQKAAEQKRKQVAAKALSKQIAEEQAAMAAARNKQQLSEIDRYKSMIVQDIQQNWLVPSNANKNLSTQLLINLGPGGVVLNVQIVRSSGNPVLDRSAQTAVLKSSPLPVPSSPELFDKFRTLRLTVRPEDIIGAS